jgi:molecular chaperone HtpG
MLAKKTLEINPHHSVSKEMLRLIEVTEGDMTEAHEEYARLLYSMALINSGFDVGSEDAFTSPLAKLINVGFGLERDEPVTEIEVDITEEEDDSAQNGGEQEINLEDLMVEEVADHSGEHDDL